MQVLVAPHVSEKSTLSPTSTSRSCSGSRCDATKPEIKAAVELVFKVQVKNVQVVNVKGKVKRSGRTRAAGARTGRRPMCA